MSNVDIHFRCCCFFSFNFVPLVLTSNIYIGMEIMLLFNTPKKKNNLYVRLLIMLVIQMENEFKYCMDEIHFFLLYIFFWFKLGLVKMKKIFYFLYIFEVSMKWKRLLLWYFLIKLNYFVIYFVVKKQKFKNELKDLRI